MNSLERTSLIIGIIVGLIIIGGALLSIWRNVGDTINSNDVPFDIKLSPTYFDEGNYDPYHNIPFLIEIFPKSGKNITFLELKKDNFKVSRKDGGLNKPNSNVIWKDSNSDNIFYFNPSSQYYHYPFSTMKSEGKMSICNNCFIGDNYPYLFTFTIYYKENSGELKFKTFNEIIPIK